MFQTLITLIITTSRDPAKANKANETNSKSKGSACCNKQSVTIDQLAKQCSIVITTEVIYFSTYTVAPPATTIQQI